MVAARLVVERGSVADPSQDWGEHEFVALPSPGDRVAAPKNGATHYMTVLCVHHRPVALGTGTATTDAAPQADVVAKWTGST